MSPTLAPELQQRLNVAAQALAQAERELTAALLTIRGGDRGDKVMVSASLEAAFEKVSFAKAALAALVAEQR